MKLQELAKNALIDAGIADYAIDTVDAGQLRQGELIARQTANALNNDPALSFGLDMLAIECACSLDINFPLPEREEQ